ncbi:unnamed protein product [Rhizoctonia solani]|uniref:Uncharacterized protein n=1 Tax=Rhizoctonia solani TaxID=456999 RepID=A0A8H3BGE0_9AGAM|nr:unnamed protein product [Rhizoctonia solani]
MPGGPPGVDQNSELAKKSDSYPGSPNTDVGVSAHSFDSVPAPTSFDPCAPSPGSDIPKIEVDQTIEAKMFSPTRVSNPLLPLDASRSEVLCANLQDETSVSGIDSAGTNLAPCLDEIDTFRRLDNGNALFNASEDQWNKVVCLEDDSAAECSAVGTGAPPFILSEQADGLSHDLLSERRQTPHTINPATVSTSPLGGLRTPDTIDHDPKLDITVKSELEILQGNKDDDDPFNFMSDDNTNEKSNLRASGTPIASPFDQPFDVIFGADIVYELSHATLVRGVVERLLRKPSYRPESPPAYFYLIMPLRPTHADEANSVDMAFPRAEDVISKEAGEGEILAIVRTETYARSAGVGRADEVQYVHYCIGWV